MALKEDELLVKIAKSFANLGFQVHPGAIKLLKGYVKHNSFDAVVKEIASSLDPSVLVISPEHIKEFIKKKGKKGEDRREEKRNTGLGFKMLQLQSNPVIIKSFSSFNSEKHEGFLRIFVERYERISGVIKRRINALPIRSVKSVKSGSGEEFAVVGIVSSIKKTAKGNILVELEDVTGSLPIILQNKEEIINDEIIGVTGYLSKNGFFIATRLTRPDVSLPSSSSLSYSNNEKEQKPKPTYVIFISDLHIGSHSFLEDAWYRFVHWINDKAENEGNIASLVVAGDIVDGIGVYPEQEGNLAIKDIKEQYETAGKYFNEISSIPIVIAPGSHDAVYNAEPQPPLPKDLRYFFPSNTIFVSNPAYIKICGRLILIYHGASYDDFINAISRLSYSKPAEVMVEMLQRRHIAPIYGKSVPIVANRHDYGVIDPIPDILHCGHAHTVGISRYRNVLLINSGCWQSQTEYQRKRNITPMTGCITVVELYTMKAKVMEFIA